MAVNKKPRKRYSARPRSEPKMSAQPLKVAHIMQPFDEVIYELETRGTVSVVNGEAAFIDMFYGDVYKMVPAALGFLQIFEIYERRYDANLEMGPLKQFISRLHYGTPITQIELDSAKAALDRIRKAIRSMTYSEMLDLVDAGLIKQNIERLERERNGVDSHVA